MVDLPPVQYDHPFQGELQIVEVADQAAIHRACFPYLGAYACSRIVDNGVKRVGMIHVLPLRLMWVNEPTETKKRYYACLIRHEVGHLNGAPADHTGDWRPCRP